MLAELLDRAVTVRQPTEEPFEATVENLAIESNGQDRSSEFLAFLKEVEKATPNDLELHLVLDNFPRKREVPPATHKTPAVQA